MSEISVIDWKASVRKADNEKAAITLLGLFVAQLPNVQKQINHYAGNGNLFRLEDELRRLLSACTYCCLPRLQAVLEDFQQVAGCMAEKDHALLKVYLDEFNEQVNIVLDTYQTQFKVITSNHQA